MKKIKAWWINLWKTKAEREQIKKLQRYYFYLREGAEFILFVKKDLNKLKGQGNRHARRRMEKALGEGKLSNELILRYKNNVTAMLDRYDAYLNPPKPGAVKIEEKK